MSRFFVLLLTLVISLGISILLVRALPGHFHHDETKIMFHDENMSWAQSWNHPERPIASTLFDSFKSTVQLQLLSLVLVLVLSFTLSFLALRFEKGVPLFQTIFFLGVSAPSFLWIPLLVYFLSLKLNLLPLRFENHFLGWILPLAALTIRPLCLSSQLLLNELKNSEHQPYFIVARSKGLSRLQAFFRHGLKNSLIPYSTQMGSFFVQSLMGSILVETLFSFPGLGTLFVSSLQSRDLPLVLYLTFIFTALVLIVQTGVEIFHHQIEPREKGTV